MPRPTLITGAAGSGKTERAIAQIKRMIDADPFAPIWVVLPNERQVASFQARLMATLERDRSDFNGQATIFNVACLGFYKLYGRLLPLTGSPQRRIASVTQTRVLHTVIRSLAEEGVLTHFAPIAATPGLSQLVASFIRELKQARITPEQFQSAAQTGQPQDKDLALIYARYQATLKDRNLVDIEGEGWLALARLEAWESTKMLPIDLLVIDGFDQFNRVQAELLGLLAKRVAQMVITLTYQPERAETAHRRFSQTYRQLSRFVTWYQEPVAHASPSRSPILARLSETLFEREGYPEPSDNETADLHMIEAADPRREVEQALRLVKRELLNGTPPEAIAVVARDLAAYRPYLIDRAAAYGIPITGEVETPLIENPVVLSLLAVIDLAASGFPRRVVIDLLHNPYLTVQGFAAELVDQLDRISRQQLIIAGREQWLTDMHDFVMLRVDDANEDEAIPADPVADGESVARNLAAFFDLVTPPDSATPYEYAIWIERLIGTDPDSDAQLDPVGESGESNLAGLGLIANIRRWSGDPAIVARDVEALCAFKKALNDLLVAYELLDETKAIPWSDFRSDLGSLTESAPVRGGSEPSTGGQVFVGSVFEARGLPLDSVYVLGLSEGQFPARDPEPILYLDTERQKINTRLHLESTEDVALNTHAERADEGSLFYELTALAHRRLTLLRPYSAPDGTTWPPSIYWTAVQNAVRVTPRHLSMNDLVSIAESATLAETLTAVAYGLNQSSHAESMIEFFGVVGWLESDPIQAATWEQLRRSRQIALDRLRNTRNEYNGYLQADLTREAVDHELGPDHQWSAAQFNDYGSCPYGFFAKRLLNIEPLEEPEPGLSAQVRGSLLHEILEKTYQQVALEYLTITPANQERALALLDRLGRSVCAGAPRRYGFRPDGLWNQGQADLMAELRQLVKADFSADSPVSKLLSGQREPVAQESAFAQAILTGAAGVVNVRGRIDRIDRSTDGLLVIDYKSGTTRFNEADIREGRSVQTLIYLHVVDQTRTASDGPIRSAFWHTANGTISGGLPSQKDETLIDTATEALHERVIAARNGIFPGEPSKITDGKCSSYCAFSALCRVRAG